MSQRKPPLQVYIGYFLLNYRNIVPNDLYFFVMHRYDIETTGAIVVAKNQQTYAPTTE